MSHASYTVSMTAWNRSKLLAISASAGVLMVASCATVMGIDKDYERVGRGGAGGSGASAGTGGSGASTGGASSGTAGTGGSTTTSSGGGTAGSGSTPDGDCGEICNCIEGDTCEFTCATPPCDANCDQGSTCTAECADATCNCNGGSTCAFTCVAPSCRALCISGSACTLDCGTIAPDTLACQFNACAAGVTACPDGHTLACNAPCP